MLINSSGLGPVIEIRYTMPRAASPERGSMCFRRNCFQFQSRYCCWTMSFFRRIWRVQAAKRGSGRTCNGFYNVLRVARGERPLWHLPELRDMETCP
jgi:hypothetical protein